MDEITLPQTAQRINRSWRATWKLALRGQLGPARQIAGRWLVTEQGVAEYLARRVERARAATQL
jgi:hypothetical protein